MLGECLGRIQVFKGVPGCRIGALQAHAVGRLRAHREALLVISR